MIQKVYVPMYSAKDPSGLYSILRDDNVKLHLNRMDLDNDFLVIPDRISDYQEFLDLKLVDVCRIVKAKYGMNELETRKGFWRYNTRLIDNLFHDNVELVTDISGYTGKRKFWNNFNQTKIFGVEQEIDQFFDQDIRSIQSGELTTVLTQGQKDYILEMHNTISTQKIEVNRQVISEKFINLIGTEDLDSFQVLENDIFFPFNLRSHTAELDNILDLYPDSRILLTDPGNDLKNWRNPPANLVKIEYNLKQYYKMLSKKPTIIYNSNLNLVFHICLADFIYFNCKIICPFEVPKLDEILIKK